MFKEVMNDLWLARISSLSNEVGLYVVLLEVLLFMPNSLIRDSKSYKHDIVGSLVLRNDNIFVMKRGKTLNSFLFFKYRLRSTINTIFEFVNPTLY